MHQLDIILQAIPSTFRADRLFFASGHRPYVRYYCVAGFRDRGTAMGSDLSLGENGWGWVTLKVSYVAGDANDCSCGGVDRGSSV